MVAYDQGQEQTFKTCKSLYLDEKPLKPLKWHFGPILTCILIFQPLFVSCLSSYHFRSRNIIAFAHLNVRSIKSNANNTIDQLQVMFDTQHIDVWAVSETWLNPNVGDAEITVDGYSLYRNDRTCHGGGVKSSIPILSVLS